RADALDHRACRDAAFHHTGTAAWGATRVSASMSPAISIPSLESGSRSSVNSAQANVTDMEPSPSLPDGGRKMQDITDQGGAVSSNALRWRQSSRTAGSFQSAVLIHFGWPQEDCLAGGRH